MSAPALPAQISSDGRELWDWAGKFSEHVHRQDRIRELNARIGVIGTKCGDCDKWMKSHECPKEQSSMSGYNKGPSCGERKCSAFVESRGSGKLRDDLTAQLAAEMTPTEGNQP